MEKYKGPFYYADEFRAFVDSSIPHRVVPQHDVVALLNRPSSLLGMVPSGWWLDMITISHERTHFTAWLMTRYEDRLLVKVHGTGPTPEAAIKDAANRVGR